MRLPPVAQRSPSERSSVIASHISSRIFASKASLRFAGLAFLSLRGAAVCGPVLRGAVLRGAVLHEATMVRAFRPASASPSPYPSAIRRRFPFMRILRDQLSPLAKRWTRKHCAVD